MVPNVNFIESAEPYVKKMMLERYSPKRLMEESVDMIQAISRSMRLWPDFPHNSCGTLARDVYKPALLLKN